MSEESVKWFLYGVLAVLGVEFLFYMIVLIVWGEREMRLVFVSMIASMIVGFVQGTILLLGIDIIFSTHYFSFINAFVVGIMSIALRKFNLW